VAAATGVEVMIAPTYTALYQVAQALKGSAIALGAQDLFWEKQGAFTGKISAEMLVDAGCTTSSSVTPNAASSLVRPMKPSIGK
jgi:triosephosphate isomerase